MADFAAEAIAVIDGQCTSTTDAGEVRAIPCEGIKDQIARLGDNHQGGTRANDEARRDQDRRSNRGALHSC